MKTITTGNGKFKGQFEAEFMEPPFFSMTDKEGYHYESVADYAMLINKMLTNGYRTINEYAQKLVDFGMENDLAIVCKNKVDGFLEVPSIDQVELASAYEELQSKLHIVIND